MFAKQIQNKQNEDPKLSSMNELKYILQGYKVPNWLLGKRTTNIGDKLE